MESEEARNINSNLITERDDALETIKSLTLQQSQVLARIDELEASNKDLNQSLIKAGQALDDAVNEKEAVENECQRQLREYDFRLDDERKKWDQEKNHSKQQTDMLQQSSEAALYKLQGERQQISAVRDQLVEQKSLAEKYKNEIENWKRKFQDQYGDRTSLEKKIVGLQSGMQEKDENLDQLKIEKDMWKSKYDELVSVRADKVCLNPYFVHKN